MTKPKPNQAATQRSTNSSESKNDQRGGASSGTKGTWFQVKIDELEASLRQAKLDHANELDERDREIELLRKQVGDTDDLRAQIAAKDKALGARIGDNAGEMGPIPDVGWGLLWQEYWTRKRQFQFVSQHGGRPKTDRYGNEWSLKKIPNLEGLGEEHAVTFRSMGEQFGYDPYSPPQNEYMLLHCFPNKGAYDMACQEIEKSQEAYRSQQKEANNLRKAVQVARDGGNSAAAQKASRSLSEVEDEIQKTAAQFNQCKAVIENAVQQYYLIPMEAFENMDLYGVPIRCKTAVVVPQKRHTFLPEITPVQSEEPPVQTEELAAVS